MPTPMKLTQVLVPIDFSPASIKTVNSAIPFLEKSGAAVTLLYVAPDLLAGRLPPSTEILDQSRKELEKLAASEPLKKFSPRVEVRIGSPYHGIAETARAINADLIIISTHGQSRLRKAFLGSTAERVVRHAHCPVLVIAIDVIEGMKECFPLKRLLVPTDFSDPSRKALQYALNLAESFDGSVSLLHVVEPLSTPCLALQASITSSRSLPPQPRRACNTCSTTRASIAHESWKRRSAQEMRSMKLSPRQKPWSAKPSSSPPMATPVSLTPSSAAQPRKYSGQRLAQF